MSYIRSTKAARTEEQGDTPAHYKVLEPFRGVHQNNTAPVEAPTTSKSSNNITSSHPELHTPIQPRDTRPDCATGLPSYLPTRGQYRQEHDILPEAPPAPIEEFDAVPTLAPRIRRVILRVGPEPVPYTTPLDSFGQYRVYPSKPLTVPDSACELEDVSEVQIKSTNKPTLSINELIFPCPNFSAFLLQHWHWVQGNKKSNSARKSLVQVITHPDFKPTDLSDIDWRQLDELLAAYKVEPTLGLKSHGVSIRIPPRTPAAAAAYTANPTLGTFEVPTLKSMSLVDAVKASFSKNNTRLFHYEPYEAYCKDPKTSKVYRSYGEVYESERMLKAHQAIQKIKLDEPCNLPRCTATIMAFSDATQLAEFGTAQAWPIRVMFGNLSKYERCRPSGENHYEVGYIPTLPASIQDELRKLESGRPIPKALLTHLRRELIHAVWENLLDDSFLQAWRHGIVIRCADGITRRVFPRIFSYSADYQEKVLLATIRGTQSLRPCPRCEMPKSEFAYMGLPQDMARRQELKRIDDHSRNKLIEKARSIIYLEGRAVTSKGVEQLLKQHSYVPTNNAFSQRLRLFGFDIFDALTVDFLHEFELGVWKSTFLHILRILHSTGSKTVATFNERFRLIPSFGDGTIRSFSQDVSDMTRPAARNYEDVLQCIIPVLEGLLPRSIEPQVLTLLFVLAQWHALGKLRRHTDMTIQALRHTTTRLGHELRNFRQITSEMNIYETPKEQSTRQRRTTKRARPRAALAVDESESADQDTPVIPPADTNRRCRSFNLDTPKYHALGDYPDMIESMGTTDSFSTQTGELLHRHTKRRYARTNGRQYLDQMSRIQRIETRLNDIHDDIEASGTLPTKTGLGTGLELTEEDLPTGDAGRLAYQIAASQKNLVLLSRWLKENRSDPALKEFMPRLKSHLHARLSGGRYQDEVDQSLVDLSKIQLQWDRIYAHQTLKIRYTTYDVRRAQDTVNPGTPKRFVLVSSDEPENSNAGAHRFWYARVLGIYHANVSYGGGPSQRMDFLWVRWLGRAVDAPGGWETCRLDQVAYFADSASTHAFDFVDPIDVIRAAHLIPRFVGHQSSCYLESLDSLAVDDSSIGDWEHYYLNRFVDRDMFMRFSGMAIGHMTQANAPESTIGIPDQTLELGYEYIDHEEQDGGDRGDRGSEMNEGEGDDEDEADDESDEERREYDDTDESMQDDEDDDEMSW